MNYSSLKYDRRVISGSLKKQKSGLRLKNQISKVTPISAQKIAGFRLTNRIPFDIFSFYHLFRPPQWAARWAPPPPPPPRKCSSCRTHTLRHTFHTLGCEPVTPSGTHAPAVASHFERPELGGRGEKRIVGRAMGLNSPEPNLGPRTCTSWTTVPIRGDYFGDVSSWEGEVV